MGLFGKVTTVDWSGAKPWSKAKHKATPKKKVRKVVHHRKKCKK